MHRVRIGITGLAVVFLIVLLAASIVGFHTKERTGSADLSAEGDNSSKAPTDPLAELGVAPGGTGGDSAPTQPSPPER